MSIYRELEKQFQKKRDYNEFLLERRRKEVYEEIPEIREIERNLSLLGIEAAKDRIRGGERIREREIEEELHTLEAMKESLLMGKGYPRDYLTAQYACADCEDTGVLANGNRCHCYERALTEALYEMSNIKKMLLRQNFSTFDINHFSNAPFQDEELTPRENMEYILKTVHQFIDEFGDDNQMNLLLYGPTGLGKTFLSNAIAAELMSRNYSVVYQTAFTLMDILEERKFKQNRTPEVDLKYQFLMEADLLIIDDLGTELINSFTVSQIFNIVNTRYIASKKTIISTNLNPGEIAASYTDRVFSRIFATFVPIRFFGPDLRWE